MYTEFENKVLFFTLSGVKSTVLINFTNSLNVISGMLGKFGASSSWFVELLAVGLSCAENSIKYNTNPHYSFDLQKTTLETPAVSRSRRQLVYSYLLSF